MDKDEVKGKVKTIKGRVKRQAGGWTGDQRLETEGTLEQAEGKVQKAWGKTKEAVRNIGREEGKEEETPHRRKPAA
jgi:uncharacterized protein YjbJ (UPF0337 family)